MAVAVVLLLATRTALAQTDTLKGYHIGNSLTGCSMLDWLEDSYSKNQSKTPTVAYHIDHSQSASRIAANPAGVSGLDGSVAPYGAWNNALPNYQWDYVTIQPFPVGQTGEQEVAGIQTLIDSAKSNSANANTKFYIYEDWPYYNGTPIPTFKQQWDAAYTDFSQPLSTNSINHQFFDGLYPQLQAANPTTSINIIPVGEVLSTLDVHLRAGEISGISSAYDLYYDLIHLNNAGAYVAHMTVLSTILDQDPATITLDPQLIAKATPEFRALANAVIWDTVNVPEPSSLALLAAGTLAALAYVWRHRK